jgi:hypothetical protein
MMNVQGNKTKIQITIEENSIKTGCNPIARFLEQSLLPEGALGCN